MKKLFALILALLLVVSLTACTESTRISVENPAKLMIEKAGGSMAITLTDAKTVGRITDVVEQIPLQDTQEPMDAWTYRITWQDADGRTITAITLSGTKLIWEGKTYSVGLGLDLSALTDVLETIPGLNK